MSSIPSGPKAIKDRQRFLKSRGFDPGPVDGQWGAWTAKAEAAYQESMTHVTMVKNLQAFLNLRGASPKLAIDGIYGPDTRAAELSYQASSAGGEGDLAKPMPTPPSAAVHGDARAKVMQVAKSLVGTREVTGHNDGPQVDKFLEAVGAKGSQEPYCAAFIVYVGDMAFGRSDNPYPRSAWSPDMTTPKPTWQQGIGGKTPLPGDAFGIYFASKGRIAHTGLIAEWAEGTAFCLTIEGNTGPSGSVGESDRNGDGVYLKRRMKSDIFTVKDWIG